MATSINHFNALTVALPQLPGLSSRIAGRIPSKSDRPAQVNCVRKDGQDQNSGWGAPYGF